MGDEHNEEAALCLRPVFLDARSRAREVLALSPWKGDQVTGSTLLGALIGSALAYLFVTLCLPRKRS